MRASVVVWGASGLALKVLDNLRLNNQFDMVGLIDGVSPERAGTVFDWLPILGGREQLARLQSNGIRDMILAFGENATRLAVAELVTARGFSLVKAVHPKALVAASATIGPGTVVGAGAVIGPMAKIGANVSLNTLAMWHTSALSKTAPALGRAWLWAHLPQVAHGVWMYDALVDGSAVMVRERLI